MDEYRSHNCYYCEGGYVLGCQNCGMNMPPPTSMQKTSLPYKCHDSVKKVTRKHETAGIEQFQSTPRKAGGGKKPAKASVAASEKSAAGSKAASGAGGAAGSSKKKNAKGQKTASGSKLETKTDPPKKEVVEQKINYSESEGDETETKDSDAGVKETRGHGSLVEMVQKSMDHTMRAYFMHTMEKLECLSAQLLRNECLTSKMHLDIIEKMCTLSKRNAAQSQALLIRLNALLGSEQSRRSQTAYNSGCCNSEDNDMVMGYNMDPVDEVNMNAYYNNMHNNNNSNGNGNCKKSRRPSQRNSNARDSYSTTQNYAAAPKNNIYESSYDNYKAPRECDCMEEKQSNCYDDFATDSNHSNETRCYCMCQRQVQCLQDALKQSLRELEQNLKRIQKKNSEVFEPEPRQSQRATN